MCVAGEPGIGKTTIVEEFLGALNAADDRCRIAHGRCSERLAGTEAYLPWLEALESLLRADGGESIARLMKLSAPTWYHRVAPAPFRSASSAPLEPAAVVSQEQMKRELSAFVRDVSALGPLVLFFDDVHWADASTIDLLSYLAARFDRMPVLILATYRPSELLLAQHPFVRVKLDLQAHGVCRELPLGFLGIDDVARYLALEFPGHRFPPDLAAVIHARTEGNPLFTVDLVQYLRDRQVFGEEDGRAVLAQPVPDIQRELPESVRSMVEAKIAQIGEADLRLLAAAGVQGSEFDSAVVATALAADASDVEERLDVLERVHALVRLVSEQALPNRVVTLRYRFVHVLYQNALFASLRPTRRMALSRAVAEALLGHWGDQRPAIAADLAVLFETARDGARAAEYFLLAAGNAARISANHEAVALARRGLRALENLPDTPERVERELLLETTLGPALMAAGGWGASEVEATYSRARELCRCVEGTPQVFTVVQGLCQFYIARAEYEAARELAEQLLALAGKAEHPATVLGHNSLSNICWLCGDWTGARTHAERAMALYDVRHHHAPALLFSGNDAGVACLTFAGLAAWSLGYPAEALRKTDDAIALAATLGHTESKVFALVFQAMVHQRRRDAQRTREQAEAAIALATQHQLPAWLAWGALLRGWAIVEQGETAHGLAALARAVADWRATGLVALQPYFLSLLADGHVTAERPAEGLAVVEEALAISRRTHEGFAEAELHRLAGELVRDPEEAEGCFRRAIEISRRQDAKSFELRAVISLSRLYEKQGRSFEARPMLAAIVAWFTEGFDTRDLQQARALLEQGR